jgi:Bacterial pre-peptidase C-terminal domain
MMMKHMVQRSLSFMVLAAGLLSCSGDPTESLRNGVAQLTADPTQIILAQGSTVRVLVQAFDEQGNAVEAKFSATAAAGITITFDSSFNRVFDANGKLLPQNPATRVRYVVEGDAVGASSFTVSGGGKSITVPVRVPPPAIAATISPATPSFGDTITITLPAPAKFDFDPADTNSVLTTIGGNECKILGVSMTRDTLSCVPLPGSVGAVQLKNVLPGFGGLGPINVPTTGTIDLTLPSLTYTPANPQAGDTITLIAPPRFDFRTTSAVTLSGATTFITKRVADTLQFLVGPGVTAPLSITNMLVTGSAAKTNIFTLAAGNVTTPAAPTLVSTQGGSQAVGTVITVTSTGRYRFSPAATSTVTLRSVLPGINAGATVTSVSADSLTLQYAIGPNVDTTAAIIGGVRISGAAGLGTFSLNTDKALFTPVTDQFPATLSTQFPVPGQAVTITAGAGYQFSTNSAVLLGSALRSAIIVSQNASSITFVPVPDIGKGKPVVTRVVAAATPNVNFTLPAAIYLTSPKDVAGDPSTAPFLTIPTTGNTVVFKDYGAFFGGLCEDDLGGPCRWYRFTLPAAASFRVTATWTNTTDLGIYFYDSDLNLIRPAGGSFGPCDAGGNGASGQPETCTVTQPAGTYYLVVDTFSAFYAAPDNVDPASFTLTLLGL